MKRSARGLLILAAITCTLIAHTTAGAAEAGVGVDTGHISVEKRLAPGGTYRLPPIGVINTGDSLMVYELSLLKLSGATTAAPQPGWFSFSPRTVMLRADEMAQIRPTLEIPVGAQPGPYFTLIQARSADSTLPGTGIAVAAATRLDFTISSSSALASWLRRARTLLISHAETTVPLGCVLGAALVIGAVVAIRRRRTRGAAASSPARQES